jgi:hypothetical protein
MMLSVVISVSLVEISETYFFSIAYGLFFALQFWLIGAHIVKEEVPRRGWVDSHVVLLVIVNTCVLFSSIACFLLDRGLVHWMPEMPKVLLYTVLGGSLNFCLVFSCAELMGEASERLCNNANDARSNIASSFERDGGREQRQSIITSHARMVLLGAGSLLSGMFFGFMFGTLRIEEESQYRVALALQQETAYTYPIGALLGGISAMLYQLIQLPLASDEQIDKVLRRGGEDL